MLNLSGRKQPTRTQNWHLLRRSKRQQLQLSVRDASKRMPVVHERDGHDDCENRKWYTYTSSSLDDIVLRSSFLALVIDVRSEPMTYPILTLLFVS